MTASPRSALERLTQLRGSDPVGDYYPRVSDLRADVLTLLSTVEQMREALKPFADAFDHQTNRPSLAPHRRAWNAGMPGHWPVEVSVTMADGRRARDLLAAPTEDKPHG